MVSKILAAYIEVFRWIQDWCPEFHPQEAMANYEAAIREAITTVWPECRFHGCHFHYCEVSLVLIVHVNLWGITLGVGD